jgi:hypothetical protein
MRHRLTLAICNRSPIACCWKNTGENVEASKGCATCQSIVSAVLKELDKPNELMCAAGGVMIGMNQNLPVYDQADICFRTMIDVIRKEEFNA